MAGRDDTAIANSVAAVVQALMQANNNLAGQNQNHEHNDEERRLDRFMRHNPPVFKGRYDPDGAYAWLQGVEKIFRAMATSDVQKVRLATHMLSEEDESWWLNTCQRLMATGVVISWDVFRDAFLEKYFPEDVKCKKGCEFLELKQGNMSVADYAAKFEELSRFCPRYLAGGSDA